MVATVLTGVSGGLGAALFDAVDARRHRIMALGRHFTTGQRVLASDEPDRVQLRGTDLSGPVDTLPGTDELATFLSAAPDEPAVLIHNAGAVQPIGAVGTLDGNRLAAAVSVNLTAAMLLTNTFLAAAGNRRPLRILYISSGAARRAIGGWAAYCATKAGGEMFFDTLAEQYAGDRHVRVASVNPGVMDTDMQAMLRDADDVYFPDRQRYVGLHQRGELPAPATVAAAIVADQLADLPT